jgi:hypothetical protein
VSSQPALGRDAAALGVGHHGRDQFGWRWDWLCEKWEQDKVDHATARLIRDDPGVIVRRDGVAYVLHALGTGDVWRPIDEGLPSEFLRRYGIEADDLVHVPGNLLLNEGIQRLLDLLTAALSNQVAANPYSNTNAFVGVGDSNTAEAASQVELQAAANRFYKAMRTTGYPVRPGSNGAQSVDWAADFVSAEANWAWAEWSVAAGATTASGGGWTTGTTNLNRKVQSLGTKTTGTWTLTGTVTLS